MINPNDDGITHINCYSKGKTELGRLLSNFAHTPFTCEDGTFASIEGYWYWLGLETHPMRSRLKVLYGYQAKEVGRAMRGNDYPEIPNFQEKVWAAVRCKINQTHKLKRLLNESTLPLVHYYEYEGKVVHDGKSDWLWGKIQSRRDEVRSL